MRSKGLRAHGIRAAIAAAALIGAPLVAATVKDGVDAWSRGDFAAAVAAWQGPAAEGDADAQFNLAQAYKLGRGVSVDLKRAEELFRKAADKGHLQAGDNYGMMLFQSGRRQEALPWLTASAGRGEPRAQYVLGIAHYNGDLLPRDPVRAYALMSRAASTGLDQAVATRAMMDKEIPLAERERGAALAAQLESEADNARARQLAAVDLGVVAGRQTADAEAAVAAARAATRPGSGGSGSGSGRLIPDPAANAAATGGPVTAGADYANPVVVSSQAARGGKTARRVVGSGSSTPAVAVTNSPAPAVATASTAAAARPAAAATPPASSTAKGAWRVQLGAFSVRSNADALWTKLSGRAALAGKQRYDIGAGGLTRLQAGPFASQGEAARACAALKGQGQACLPVRS